MLIANSPFPPYAPVKLALGIYPDVGDLSTGKPYGTALRAKYVWTDGDYGAWDFEYDNTHRDGDFPAIVTIEPNSCVFYKQGVKHRINGEAVFKKNGQRLVVSYFYLYGNRFSHKSFEQVNRYAIKHKLPVWVASLAFIFKAHLGDLDELAVATVEAFNMLPSIQIDWLIKLWGVQPSWWDHVATGKTFNNVVDNFKSVIDYELSLPQQENQSFKGRILKALLQ